MTLSTYMKIFSWDKDPDYVLCYSTKTSAMILLEKPVLLSVQRGTCSDEERKTLTQLGFLISSEQKEKDQMRGFFHAMNKNTSLSHIIIVMNFDCNLACPYCYEGQMKGNFYMSYETADRIIHYIKRQYIDKGKNIHIDFYGGEPLLSFDLMVYLSKEIRSKAEQAGVEYSSTAVNNGTLLTEQRVQKLAALGLQDAQITIDGLKEQHNLSRPYKSGKGSFDTIILNLRKAAKYIKIQVVSNYTKKNYHGFPRILDYLCDKGIAQDTISMVRFVPVTKTAGISGLSDSRQGCSSMNEPWIFIASIELREEIMKRGFNTPRLHPAFCMLESKEDIVINYDGTFYKCPGFIGLKKFNVGDVIHGERKRRELYHLDVWQCEKCLNCPYLPLCFGGCRYRSHINSYGIGAINCRKPFFDATLEAFVKQEIEYTL
ncbi:MAG: geopeptide radical SAM maturase [bacterium]